MLREYIYSRIGYIYSSCPAWRCPGATAGFSGSPPGDAPPVPLPLVWLGRVGLWWLESGRCNLTDAAYLLSHSSNFCVRTFGTKQATPLRTFWVHIPPSWCGLNLNPPSPLFSTDGATLSLARLANASS